MQELLMKKIEVWMDRQGILKEQDVNGRTGIVAGVSGGADSVCLLRVLSELAKKYPLMLYVVHVNHGIRDQEADRDQAFVEDLCKELGIFCRTVKRDVPALARETGQTLEEAGRQVRYQVFEEERKRTNSQWIAVAHHKEDQAETILLNLFRGSFLNGLGGMRPVQGYIIRPLFDCAKEEITDFLRKRNVGWCQDSTNEELFAARNQLRLKVMPEIRRIQPEIIDVLCQSGMRFQEASDFLVQAAEDFLETEGEETEEGLSLPISALSAVSPGLRSQVLYQALERVCGRRKDLTARHIALIWSLSEGQSGRRLMLPYQTEVSRSYDRLLFHKKSQRKPSVPEVEMYVIPGKDREKFQENDCTKRFAYDKMTTFPILRFRQPGDRIALYADGRGKKLQDFFTDRKIPAWERDKIPVLALGDQILWVYGYRKGTAYPVTEDTRQILIVTIQDTEVHTKE